MNESLAPWLVYLAGFVALLSYVYRMRSLSSEERREEIRAGLHRARPYAEAWAVRRLPIWIVAVLGMGALGYGGAKLAANLGSDPGPGGGGVLSIFRRGGGNTPSGTVGTPTRLNVEALSTVVSGGSDPDTARFNAYLLQDSAAGTRFKMPAGDTAWWATKITSATVPESNAAPGMSLAYTEGPNLVSWPWTRNDTSFYSIIMYKDAGTQEHWICDYVLGHGCVSYWQVSGAPADRISFSSSQATPNILFYVSSNTLRRYDASARALANTGAFPVSVGSSTGGWLTSDDDDSHFSMLTGANDSVLVWNSSTGVRTKTVTNLNEPNMLHGGDFVLMQVGGSETLTQKVWDLVADTIATYNNAAAVFHAGSLYGLWTAFNTGFTPMRFHDVRGATGVMTTHWTNSAGYCPDGHQSGKWRQPDVPIGEQWYMTVRDASNTQTCDVRTILGLINIDGQTPRIIADNFHDFAGHGNNTNYWCDTNGGAQMSPDGVIVAQRLDFNVNDTNPRCDVVVIEMPTIQ